MLVYLVALIGFLLSGSAPVAEIGALAEPDPAEWAELPARYDRSDLGDLSACDPAGSD